MDILDQILAAEMANEYTDSKQLAHTEKKVYTFDGNAEGKTNIFGYVKISDDEPDLEKVVSIESTSPEGIITLSKDMLSVAVSDGTDGFVEGIQTISAESDILGIVVPDIGLLVMCVEDPVGTIFVSRIELETIHQIDPKFIPGAVLPVVTLSCDTVMNAFNSGEPYPLTASESATFEAMKNSGGLVILRANTGDKTYALGLCSADYSYSRAVYQCNMHSGDMNINVTIDNNGGNWTMTVVIIEQ